MIHFVGIENNYKPSEVAARFNVKTVTVRAWLNRGLFPNAKFVETVAGSVWQIPESDVINFVPPVMGRPKKEGEK